MRVILSGLLDETQFARLLAEAWLALQPFTEADETVAFAMSALIITANRR